MINLLPSNNRDVVKQHCASEWADVGLSNGEVAGLIPRILQLHQEVQLSKILTLKSLLMSRFAPPMESSAIST